MPFPTPGYLLDPGIKPTLDPVPPALASRFFTTSITWEAMLDGRGAATESAGRLVDEVGTWFPRDGRR